uniref:Uncharacterized protein n=1 Tax=Avena sativa TaxID=4498 RepID=A0ACD5UJN1_AVESA
MRIKRPRGRRCGESLSHPPCRTRARVTRVTGARYFTTPEEGHVEKRRHRGLKDRSVGRSLGRSTRKSSGEVGKATAKETMEADLRELARLPDVLAVCSSAGWTDQKHVLYLSLLQESFVNQLHQGEIGFRGLSSNLFPRPSSRHKQSSKADRAKSMTKVEQQVRSTSSEHQEEVHSTDDDASSAETVQESSSSSSQAGATSEREDSLSRTAAGSYKRTSSEGSDQNFVDEDTEGSGESRRRRGNKRLKSAGDTMDDQVRERGCIHEGRTAASGLPQWKRRGHRWP